MMKRMGAKGVMASKGEGGSWKEPIAQLPQEDFPDLAWVNKTPSTQGSGHP